MPITFSKRNNQWLYQFNRVIAGQRHRANRLLPKGWTQAQAQKFDQQETARLYALAAGVSTQQHLIDDTFPSSVPIHITPCFTGEGAIVRILL